MFLDPRRVPAPKASLDPKERTRGAWVKTTSRLRKETRLVAFRVDVETIVNVEETSRDPLANAAKVAGTFA